MIQRRRLCALGIAMESPTFKLNRALSRPDMLKDVRRGARVEGERAGG